jgi:hypothetical protein
MSYVPDVRHRYTMSYVHHVRHRMGTTSYGYDVVRAPRTTSCATSVLYDVVRPTYDIVRRQESRWHNCMDPQIHARVPFLFVNLATIVEGLPYQYANLTTFTILSNEYDSLKINNTSNLSNINLDTDNLSTSLSILSSDFEGEIAIFSRNFKTFSKIAGFFEKVFQKTRNFGEILLEILQFLFFLSEVDAESCFTLRKSEFKREPLHFRLPNDAKISILPNGAKISKVFQKVFKKSLCFSRSFMIFEKYFKK